MHANEIQIDVDETSTTLRRLTYLFDPFPFDILEAKNIHYHYYFSIITEILIHLRDLAYKLNKLGVRADFTDHIDIIPSKGIYDITDLVKYFRDAACHNDSLNRRKNTGFLFAANVFAAYDFPDDITILMGESKIYVKRHLRRLYQTALKSFALYPQFQSNEEFCMALINARAQGVC